MNKHGYTDFYFDLNTTLTPNVKSMVAYRDELVFFTEEKQVSYIDVSQLFFTPYDRARQVSEVSKKKLFATLPNGLPAKGLIIIAQQQSDVLTSFISESDLAKKLLANVLLLCSTLILFY